MTIRNPKPRQLSGKSSVKLDKTFRHQFLGNVIMIFLPLITMLTLCGVQSMKNGHRVHDAESPFVVSIQHRLFHLCSGTIIDEYHILTIAHVVVPHSASALLVVPGMSVVRWPYYTAYAVKHIYPHPYYQELTLLSWGYSELYWDHDIAILRLTDHLPATSLMEPVSLSITNLASYQCFECAVISWNYFDESNMQMVVLMWDIVYMVENNRCEQWGLHVLVNQQCFNDFVETVFISTEDLGSPIICGGSMVGLIVKEARQGDATSPATFLSTSNYADFISEITHGGEINVQPGEFPYMVSIWHNKKHACGGLIVNSNQVITAGSCLRTPRGVYSRHTFKIAVGCNVVLPSVNCSIEWYQVTDMAIHPDYQSRLSTNPEHDIGFITVSEPFLWSSTVQAFRFADAENFSTHQLCQVLHWTRKYTDDDQEYRRLTKTTAVLVSHEQSLVQLGTFQIAVEELYSMHDPQPTDIGNPIICGGYPLGIMVRTYSLNMESQSQHIVFLHISPYASMGFFHMMN